MATVMSLISRNLLDWGAEGTHWYVGQRVQRIGQEVGRNPHGQAELATAVGAERFRGREHPGLGLDEEAQAEVSWEERGGPEPQLSGYFTSWAV